MKVVPKTFSIILAATVVPSTNDVMASALVHMEGGLPYLGSVAFVSLGSFGVAFTFSK